jgi:hypothetical protein
VLPLLLLPLLLLLASVAGGPGQARLLYNCLPRRAAQRGCCVEIALSLLLLLVVLYRHYGDDERLILTLKCLTKQN